MRQLSFQAPGRLSVLFLKQGQKASMQAAL